MSVRPVARRFARPRAWAGEGAVLLLALAAPLAIYITIGAETPAPAGNATPAPQAYSPPPSPATVPATVPTPAPPSPTAPPAPSPTATPVPAGPGPTPAPIPTAAPTPFRLVPSPVQASAAFGSFAGTCTDDPPAFNDRFTFTTLDGQLTLRQASTGQITSGPIQPDGTFHVTGSGGHEAYDGRIQGLRADAHFVEVRVGGCTGAYEVAFRFLV